MNSIIENTNKTPIEVVLKVDDEGFTTARKLYEWLELEPRHYARWVKMNLIDNSFAELEIDYSPLMVSKNKENTTQDYKIHATLAKKLAMTSRSPKGEEARNYFIECEKVLKRIAEEKHKDELLRAKRIGVRNALTDSINDSNENERMHGHAYSTYTNMIYKNIFGKDAKTMRNELNLSKKDNLRDYFSPEELTKIQTAEMLVSSLIGYGWGYNEIKDFITAQVGKYLTTVA